MFEHRIAVDAIVSILGSDGSAIGTRPFRITVRTIDHQPWVVPVGVQDLASNTTALAVGQSDDGGCNGTTGCDQNAVDVEDPTTVTGTLLCAQGAGSGTCTPGQEQPNTSPQNQAWNNGNATTGAYQP